MNKILVAEDDKFLISAYKAKFEKSSFEVKIASDGNEVLELLKTFTPDVILLDLVMPGKDGFATLTEIRNQAKFKTTPILVASNLSQPEDIARAKELGATDYIVKTDLSLAELVTKINSLL